MGTPPPKTSRAVDIFIALVIVGLIAGGIGALNSYIGERSETAALNEGGVETEAEVYSVTESRHVRGGYSTILTVAFSPEGGSPGDLTFVDLTVCTEARYDDEPTVPVVYAADDPEVARLAECKATIDSSLPLFVGIAFLALGLFFGWSFVRSFMKKRRNPSAPAPDSLPSEAP